LNVDVRRGKRFLQGGKDSGEGEFFVCQVKPRWLRDDAQRGLVNFRWRRKRLCLRGRGFRQWNIDLPEVHFVTWMPGAGLRGRRGWAKGDEHAVDTERENQAQEKS
jgi:hypothetical protein